MKVPVLIILLLYVLAFTAVEADPYLFGNAPAQLSAGLAFLIALVLFYFRSELLKPKQRAKLMMGIAAIGIILSIFLTYAHFFTASEFCPPIRPGESAVPCDIVNQSIYSEIAGFPVAILGILGYLAMFYAAYSQTKKKKTLFHNPLTLHVLAGGALLFTIWLNYIQFIELMTLCLLCEMSATSVILLTLLSYQNWRDS